MGFNGSDFKIRMPESPQPGSPLVIADTIDVTAWTDNSRPAGTRNYTGVGFNAKLYSISRPTPTPSTLTLRGAEEDLLYFIRQARLVNCEFPIQRVRYCDGRVESGDVWRQVTMNTQTREGITASGINVTDNPSEVVQEAEWNGPEIHWYPPQESRPAIYKTNQGFNYTAPEGIVDGTNDTFVLIPAPDDPSNVIVYLDGVEQVVDIDYTLTDDTIVFVTPPACGEVVLVYWTDEQSIINGVYPVDVKFCDAPSCGGGSCASKFSNGCKTFLALYQVPTREEGCVTEQLYTGALARYTLSDDGSVTLDNVSLLPDVVRPKELTCIGDQVIIIGAFGIFFACSSIGTSGCTCDCGGDTISTIQASTPVNLNEGVGVVGAVTGEKTTFYFALHDESGVLRSRNGRVWEIGLPNGQFAVGQQDHIVAAGDIIVTGGTGANNLQISRSAGKSGSWAACDGPGAANLEIIGLAIDLVGSENSYALIYVMTADPTYTTGTVWITNDFGDSWEARESFALSAFAVGGVTQPAFFQNTLQSAVDGSWVYMQYLTTTLRNMNFARDCDWEDISTSELEYPQSAMTICPSDPTQLLVVEQGLIFSDFAEPDAADLGAKAPYYDKPGNGWVVQSGTIGTSAVQFVFTAAGIATTDIEDTDTTARFIAIPTTGSTKCGIVFRLTDATNYWSVIVDEATDTVRIVETVAAVDTDRASLALTITPDLRYALTVNVQGDVVAVRVNTEDLIVYSGMTTGLTETDFGIIGSTGDKGEAFTIG